MSIEVRFVPVLGCTALGMESVGRVMLVCVGRGAFMRSKLVFACAFLVSSHAFAANVANIQGQTLLNTGAGFKQLVGATEAGPGAKVMANPGGQGQITYSDGCTVTVNPGQVYTIAPVSPCAQAGTNTGSPYAIGAAVIGGAVAAVIIATKSASP